LNETSITQKVHKDIPEKVEEEIEIEENEGKVNKKR